MKLVTASLQLAILLVPVIVRLLGADAAPYECMKAPALSSFISAVEYAQAASAVFSHSGAGSCPAGHWHAIYNGGKTWVAYCSANACCGHTRGYMMPTTGQPVWQGCSA